MSGNKAKKLFLIRHAQATSAADDKSRPLSPKGKDDALKAGIFLKDKGYIPDQIFCSPAKRTQETLEQLNKALNVQALQFPEILYSGATGDYLDLLQNCDDTISNIMIIGHNPSIYGLASDLVGGGADSAIQRLSEGYPPASMSIIECSCENWADIQLRKNTLIDFANPLDFNAPSGPSKWM
ncbi:MAG: histidine phosphatase family protein [Alphaproteobacteria bacterium]|nr:histidine phosphatase family protein [Alphaproteobacteria bacterium]